MWTLLAFLDRLLSPLYHLVAAPVPAFFIGTFLLALICVLLGEFLSDLTRRLHESHLRQLKEELAYLQEAAILAAKQGEKERYHERNRQAGRIYVRLAFLQGLPTLATFLPAGLALSWLDYRFASLKLPLPFSLPLGGDTVGYLFPFGLFYLLLRGGLYLWRSD